MKRSGIKVGGFGGQGVILSGHIIGRAASLYDRKNSALTQSYGPEARGGACSTDLVVAEEEIHNPFSASPDILVVMSQEAYATFAPKLRRGGLLLIDEDLVKTNGANGARKMHAIPATRLAEGLGRRIIANIVMLGFFTSMTGVVSKEAMETAVRESVPKGTEELNLKAFRAGYEYGTGLS